MPQHERRRHRADRADSLGTASDLAPIMSTVEELVAFLGKEKTAPPASNGAVVPTAGRTES